ncbi:hypothetical protein ACODT3_02455 [Streptomyces sp. 4.24]|uniref:hypothetical protein n=1 Tax=Streptomyces tritrimontium TaxID=3406573 RepID=UPI003BB65110
MANRPTAVPAVAGGLLLVALLWWAGASARALHLPGASGVIGDRATAELDRWLIPWSYDPPPVLNLGTDLPGETGGAAGTGSARYLGLYTTSLQIRFAALFAFFVPGAMLLIRGLPPVRGRTAAALLAVWAWGLVAGTLAMAVSAPWMIASFGHGSYRFLPQLASVIDSGRQVLVATSLVAAAVTVLVARATLKRADRPAPSRAPALDGAPARSARLAATAGTAVIALSLLVLSYHPVAAAIQTVSPGAGLLADPGDLLRQWLLLGAWDGPAGVPLGDWLLARTADVLLLAVVWWALRALPALLTRATVPAMAVGAVCATVLGLLAVQLLRVATDGTGIRWGLLQLFAGIGGGVPAALTFGLAAGAAAAVTLRLGAPRTEPAAAAPEAAPEAAATPG